MFFFGNPEDTAKLYWRNSTEITGPALADVPLDEMSEEELRNALTYARIAFKMAQQDGAGEEVMQVLVDEYDAAFQALADVSESFRRKVKGDAHVPLAGFTKENVEKYKRMAGVLD